MGERSEIDQLLASRRMCRDFLPAAVDESDLRAVLSAGLGAPAAGNTHGVDLLVLTGADLTRYWDLTLPDAARSEFPWPGLLNAPALVIVYVDPDAYLARYSEPDKAASGLGVDTDQWQVPYWWVDGGAAVMAMLAAAAGRGLGALLFGQFDHEPAVRAAFDVPSGRRAVATVALGHPADPNERRSRSARRGRPDPTTHVHWSTWGAPDNG